MNNPPFASVSSLIPHQGPMRLVDEIVSMDAHQARVSCLVRPNHLFLRASGTLAPEVFGEIIAQSFAAAKAQRRLWEGLSLDGGGYLVSLRDFTVFESAQVGDRLETLVVQQDNFLGTHIVKGQVYRGAEKLAEATVYIFMWEGKTPPEMI